MHTIKEVAEMYKVHERTVMYWVRTKKLEVFRIGTRIRVTDEALQKFIQQSNKG